MDWNFPKPMTIRCSDYGKVFDAVLTSKALHEFACPDCGKVEVYHLSAMKEKVNAAYGKLFRKAGGRI